MTDCPAPNVDPLDEFKAHNPGVSLLGGLPASNSSRVDTAHTRTVSEPAPLACSSATSSTSKPAWIFLLSIARLRSAVARGPLQEVAVVRHEAGEIESRWLIAALGEMTIGKQVSGPIRPLDQSTLDQLDAREAERAAHHREDQEWSEESTHAALNFLRLRGVGM